jgi:methylglutaconyl-CoA hydratase
MGGAAGLDERGPTRAVVLASEVDSCFCAGADLKERAGFSAEEFVSFHYILTSQLVTQRKN